MGVVRSKKWEKNLYSFATKGYNFYTLPLYHRIWENRDFSPATLSLEDMPPNFHKKS
jgi:hypothetical protein